MPSTWPVRQRATAKSTSCLQEWHEGQHVEDGESDEHDQLARRQSLELIDEAAIARHLGQDNQECTGHNRNPKHAGNQMGWLDPRHRDRVRCRARILCG